MSYRTLEAESKT